LEAEGLFSYADAVAPISQSEEITLSFRDEGVVNEAVVGFAGDAKTCLPPKGDDDTSVLLARLKRFLDAHSKKGGTSWSLVVVDDASLWEGIMGEETVRRFLHCCRVLSRKQEVSGGNEWSDSCCHVDVEGGDDGASYRSLWWCA